MSGRNQTALIALRQQRFRDEFLLFDDWSERYQYLIDLGKGLPSMPAVLRVERNRVRECSGDTFLAGERREGFLFLHASSDRPVVAGMLALIVGLYSGLEPAEIVRHPPQLLDQIGLTHHLSSHRRVALLAIHERLTALAADIEAPRRLAS